MTPKILLIGKNGQVGRELNQVLSGIGELVALDRYQLDLCKPNDIRRTIRATHPDIIVNAAAYTAVDKAETNEVEARAINADAPGVMADEAKKIGAALVHYSTDYVFDGSKNTPYVEEDPTNPINSYGRTKLAGERAIQESGVSYLIFRTAWVYAREGRNFLLSILRLATEREELRIVADQIGAPTSSGAIAAATTHILAQLCSSGSALPGFSKRSGIYHMTAAGQTTWYEFAQTILGASERAEHATDWLAVVRSGRPLLTRRIIPITSSEYPTPARRPAYSVLSNARLADVFGTSLPDWNTQLCAVFVQG